MLRHATLGCSFIFVICRKFIAENFYMLRSRLCRWKPVLLILLMRAQKAVVRLSFWQYVPLLLPCVTEQFACLAAKVRFLKARFYGGKRFVKEADKYPIIFREYPGLEDVDEIDTYFNSYMLNKESNKPIDLWYWACAVYIYF